MMNNIMNVLIIILTRLKMKTLNKIQIYFKRNNWYKAKFSKISMMLKMY